MSSRPLSLAQARRIALAAQGFSQSRPNGAVDRRHVRKVFDRIGLIQIDSVNVLVRSQELPLFARLGAHRRDLLPSMAASGELFEYWGHEASLLPVSLHPLLRWRMDEARRGNTWHGLARLAREKPAFVEDVFDQVRDRGPIATSDLTHGNERSGTWWGWSDAKRAMEYLFWCGRITARRRPNNFERVYDIPERMIPAPILAAPTPPDDEAQRELLMIAARGHGLATATDLADYFRIKPAVARPLIASLVEDGRLEPVSVEGWRQLAYLDPNAHTPRKIDARALLSPFDSLVWERSRNERFFDFHYRIEIYTPAHKRIFGYYVLPFLLGDQLVARVDLKADRQASALLVHGAYAEPAVHADPEVIAEPLLDELELMAAWLGLERVAIGDRGDITPPLRVRQKARRSSPTGTRRAPAKRRA
ncbi:MAG: winged helix-turn-helix domain-containing protein [Acidimicrobiia bacterium]